MRVLLTGCNGLLGQNVIATKAEEVEILGIDLHEDCFVKKRGLFYEKADITNRQAIKRIVSEFWPEWIIHTAAFNGVDASETQKESCWSVNVRGTENLVLGARKLGASFLHLSTDYIFDGKDGPYSEEARPNPLGYYGKSKLAAENVVVASGVDHAIVRTMVLYGYGVGLRDNFVTWLIKKLRGGESVNVVDDQTGNTTLTSELALGLWKIVGNGKTGVYNIAGSELISRYDFAKLVAEVFKLNGDSLSAVSTDQLTQAAPRPLKSGLLIEKAKSELGIHMSDAVEGLKLFKRQLKKGKSDLV